MPRVCVEDALFDDPRFIALVEEIGCEYKALGILIKFWRVAIRYYSNDEKGVPAEVFERVRAWRPLVTNGLVVDKSGSYFAKGGAESFKWLLHKKRAGKAGGNKSAELRASKSKQSSSKSKQSSSISNPLTLTPVKGSKEPNTPPNGGESKLRSDPIPYQVFKDLWNAESGTLAKIQALTKARKDKIRSRWNEKPELGYWTEVIRRIAKSDFCNGKSDRGWRASFDWLIVNDTNHVKVVEGKYDNHGGNDADREEWLKNWIAEDGQ